jgi:hypothetical protein
LLLFFLYEGFDKPKGTDAWFINTDDGATYWNDHWSTPDPEFEPGEKHFASFGQVHRSSDTEFVVC